MDTTEKLKEIEDALVPGLDYDLNFKLHNEVDLNIKMFSCGEVKYFYHYRYLVRKKDSFAIEFVNDITTYVQYVNGYPYKVEVTMNMIYPGRCGQEFVAGMDVSPNSKLHISFIYKRLPAEKDIESKDYRKAKDVSPYHPKFKLVAVEGMGGSKPGFKRLDLDKAEDQSLIKQINFPFPIVDEILFDFVGYKLPLLTTEGEESIAFPSDIATSCSRTWIENGEDDFVEDDFVEDESFEPEDC